MRKIITIIAALTITLTSCKKESVLIETEQICRLIEIEINNEFHPSDIGISIYKNNVICTQTEVFKTGDKLKINVFNHYSLNQDVEVLIYSDKNFIEGTEKYLKPSENMIINYIVK